MHEPAAAPNSRNTDWNGRALALVSLFIALSGLAYNTWRNETTEAHRNVRQAAFVLLEHSGQMQQLVDARFYGGDRSEANRIACWGKAALVRDLGALVSQAADARAQALFNTWRERAGALDAGDATAERAISDRLAAVRTQVLEDLRALR